MKYDFKIKSELNNEQFYQIEYCSYNFVVKIEKYFQEFYVTLYKENSPDIEINLFNLLEYLKKDALYVPKSEYFYNEKNFEERFKKQIVHIYSSIFNNYNLINDFFLKDNFELNLVKFEKYWKMKHPEFY